MRFLLSSCCRILSGLALAIVVLAPAAQAESAPTPPKLDLTRWNDQPVYPDGAVARGEHGNTVLTVSIDARYRVTKVAVETSSGFDDLDQAAIAAVKGLRFDSATDGSKNVPGVMKLTIHYQLTTLPEKPITEADVYALKDAGDLLVCKRQDPPIGSYVAPKPLCHTAREWDEIQRNKRDQSLPSNRGGPFIPN